MGEVQNRDVAIATVRMVNNNESRYQCLTGESTGTGGEGNGLPRIRVDDGVTKSDVPSEKSDIGAGPGLLNTTSLMLS